MSSKLELIEHQIQQLSTRERRVLKIWFDQLEGREKVVAAPNIRYGNGQKAKGLSPRIVLTQSIEPISDTVIRLREERKL